MKETLSIYFSSERVYVMMVEASEQGLDLKYVNSTTRGIDLESPKHESSLKGLRELESIMSGISEGEYRLAVTLPSDIVLVSQFPGNPDMDQEEIKKLVNLEIRQAYPQFNYNYFASNIIPMAPKKDGTQMYIAVILPKENYKNLKKVLSPLNRSISNIEISQFNAHTAFLYNYPEQIDSTVALLGIQKQFIDFSLIQNQVPLYYNLITYNDKSEIGEIISKELDKLLGEYADFINSAYFFGQALDKELLTSIQSTIKDKIMTSGRLNAFRMLSTGMEQRIKDYCIKTAHLHPPGIGACLPPYHERIKLF
jgi:hypothetical protein